MKSYLRREITHTAAAILLAVIVAVASELVGIESFEEVSLTGLALTAIRTAATAIVTIAGKRTLS